MSGVVETLKSMKEGDKLLIEVGGGSIVYVEKKGGKIVDESDGTEVEFKTIPMLHGQEITGARSMEGGARRRHRSTRRRRRSTRRHR